MPARPIRWRRRAALALLTVVALFAVLPWLSQTLMVRRWVQRTLARATQYDVRLERVRLGYDGSLTIGSLSAADSNRPPFVTVDRAQVRLRPGAWLRGNAGTLRVEAPHLFLDHLPDVIGERGGGASFPFDAVEIVDGVVHLSAGDHDVALGPLTLTLDAVEAGGGMRVDGQTEFANGAGDLHWSAQLGARLRTIEGEVTSRISRLGRLTGGMLGTNLPEPLDTATADLQMRFQGDLNDRIGVTFDATARPAAQEQPWQLSGKGEIRLIDRTATATVSGSRLSFRDDNTGTAIDGVAIDSTWKVGRAASGSLLLEYDVTAPRGEVLWNRVYVDLSRYGVSARGTLRRSDDMVQLDRGQLAVDGVGRTTLGGTYDSGRQSYTLRASSEIPALSGLYVLTVREPLQADYPVLGRTAVGGRASLTIDAEGGAGTDRLAGMLTVAGGSLEMTDPSIEMRGMNAKLPIDLADGPVAERTQTGQLSIGTMRVGGVAIDGLAMKLVAGPNRLALGEPMVVRVLGGSVEVADLRADELAVDGRHVNLDVVLRDLDLAQLSRALGWPILTGKISGAIPRIFLNQQQVRSEGEIHIVVFGGSVRIRNLHVDELLSRVPTVEFDLDFDDISLAQLTNAFEVGQISGVAFGGVRNLAIVNGEPVRFEAWMETRSRSGVPQRISVSAIRQLAILGGSGGDPLTQGVLSFFDEYRYAKLGFRCHLENDQFILHGIEERDGKQYLVVGSAIPPRVDVISHNPVISFSEMTDRLSRVKAVAEQQEKTAQ